jgi:dihydrofolate reductase
MGTLSVFNFVSLNGYFKGAKGDISWAHESPENDFAGDRLSGGNTLLFGRVTYEMMASSWPTPEAKKNAPAVAKGMNDAEKIVFSKTLKKADWNNTRVVENMIEEVTKLKRHPDKNMTLLGSGTIVTQLAQAGLIDEYQLMVFPVALSAGTPIFAGIEDRVKLVLTDTKTFKSGTVLLSYKPA